MACSLLDPKSEEEWSFLRKCALNEFDDHWVDAGAIQSLRLIASSRSREILIDAQRHNAFRSRLIAEALEHIQSGPLPMVSSNLEELARRVAQEVKHGDWTGNGKPRCSEWGDKALVDLRFSTGLDFLTYTATFHRVDGAWRLRGLQETLQALVLSPGRVPDHRR